MVKTNVPFLWLKKISVVAATIVSNPKIEILGLIDGMIFMGIKGDIINLSCLETLRSVLPLVIQPLDPDVHLGVVCSNPSTVLLSS